MGKFAIDASMPNHDQIGKLKELVRHPPHDGRSVLVEVSPNLAKYILADTTLANRNRGKRTTKIDQFADAMRSGKWSLTGDTLKFSDKLEDGQHRLTACFRAGVPFKTHAVFGVDPEHFTRMDQGTTRSGADVFNLAGVKYYAVASATTRWIKILSEGKGRGTTYTPEKLLHFYETSLRGPLLDAVLAAAIKAQKFNQCPPAPMAAKGYLAVKNGAKEHDVLRFIAQTGDLNAQPRSPGTICRESLAELKSDRAGRLHEDIRNWVIDQCLEAFLSGKMVTKSAIKERFR